MKKVKFSTELTYVLAMIIMPVAVEFAKYADFGLSMVVSPAYLMSRLVPFEWFTFGRAEYCVQALLLVAMCIVMRKFKVSYLFSFLTAFIYGNILDGLDLFMCRLQTEILWLRIIYFALSLVLTALSVSLFFNTYFIPQAYDFFVREVPKKFSLNRNRFKLIYDWSSFAVSAALCAVLYYITYKSTGKGVIEGIGIGTIICAILNSFLIGAFSKLWDKHIEFIDLLKWRKFFE